MKTIISWIITLFILNGISILRADEVMTPDGYLGHPAFEIGINGDPDSHTYTETYNYTNYTNAGTTLGNYNYNFNRIFLNVALPFDPCFSIVGGASYLFNSSGTGTYTTTANNFTGTENSTTVYNYAQMLSWFVSVKIYTK